MIQSLQLVNFKNFQDAALPLGKLTLLVGTNASGKSNLRDAFRFLHGMGRGYAVAEILGEKYVEGGVLQWKGIRGGVKEVAFRGQTTFQMKTTFLDIEGGGFFQKKTVHSIKVEVGSNGSKPRVVQESLYREGKCVFDSHPEEDPPEQEGPPLPVCAPAAVRQEPQTRQAAALP